MTHPVTSALPFPAVQHGLTLSSLQDSPVSAVLGCFPDRKAGDVFIIHGRAEDPERIILPFSRDNVRKDRGDGVLEQIKRLCRENSDPDIKVVVIEPEGEPACFDLSPSPRCAPKEGIIALIDRLHGIAFDHSGRMIPVLHLIPATP